MANDSPQISSDVIRGYNDTMILYILSQRPSYGYEISKQIRTMTDDKYVIKETTLYSAFTRMEKNGYIESYVAEPDETGSGKKRTYYKITEAGRSYYGEKCREWVLTKEVVEHFMQPALPEKDVICLPMQEDAGPGD
ncbi:MAG: PadR family transcriptional regulator [Lachnospiraceae bacterium]|nr:PadR family transcriptional regulator [Lachnospiraceae bacterium]